MSLSAYNSSRTIPPKLTWTDNRYVLFYHELQYRYLEGVAGQTTPYLRFRYTQVIYASATDREDRLVIYLPDNTANRPFTPVNNNNDLVVQFLQAMGPGDRDFSVGLSGTGYLRNDGSKYYYEIYLWGTGGLTRWRDYMVQIS